MKSPSANGEGEPGCVPRQAAASPAELRPLSAAATLLSIDLGTVTGWAIRHNGVITSGTENFKPGRYSGGGMRFLKFVTWLDALPRPDAVVFEEVRRHLGTDAAHVYGGFLAHLTAWCEQRQIPYSGVPVGAIKKFATGKGNADKAAMIAAAEAKGYAPHDDNEADALMLLDYALTGFM